MKEDVHMYGELIIEDELRTCTLEDFPCILGLHTTTSRLSSLDSSRFYTVKTL
jgi:hypothetical protein